MSNDILARYECAQAINQGNLTKRVVRNDAVLPHWIDGSRFWYRRDTPVGKQFRLVDAKAASNAVAFDHKVLADALTKASGKPATAEDLPLRDLAITESPAEVRFQAFGKHWLFKPDTQQCEETEAPPSHLVAPDGTKAAFLRDNNLWVRDLSTGKEQALTQDGTEDCGYARAQFDTNKVQAAWSPDSRRLFTVQLDLRKVASRPTIHYVPRDGSLRPRLAESKAAFPGDEHVENHRLFAIEVATGHIQAVNYDPLPLITYGEELYGFFSTGLGWWSADSRRAYFVDVTRGSKAVRVVELDSHTGATRVLFEETSDTFVKLRHETADMPQFMPLPDSNELIWFSERTGCTHLYLYDMETGKLKNTITSGQWLVRDVLHYDPKQRTVLLQTAGRDPEVSPYYRDICMVDIDTGTLKCLASGPFEHVVFQLHSFPVMARGMLGMDSPDAKGVSPSGQYLVTTRSRVDTVPVSVLLDREGREVLTLETADTSGLPKGWHWPEPIKLKGADGKTDIHAVVFRPPGFSPEASYPVVEYSTSMRHTSTLPQGSFANSSLAGFGYCNAASVAALGFVVVMMEGRGLPLRHKAFQDHHYGDDAFTSDFDDRIAGFRQLAERYPYMDIERIGITGWEAKTNAIYGLLNHPDFFKAVVINCFTDPRLFLATQSETYDGITPSNVGTLRHAEHGVAALKGKLFLIVGMLATAAPSSMFRLVEALQKANKDFDMLCMPNVMNQVTSYSTRREWDFLVRHLQGVEPPKEFKLTTGEDLAHAAAAA